MDQEALKKKIEAALRKACLPDKTPTIELEASNVSRVGGRVISKRFAKMTQTARQDLIWSFLDKSLTAHEATQISFIVTDTKQEHDALQRAG
jgi:stress-induced morphogen